MDSPTLETRAQSVIERCKQRTAVLPNRDTPFTDYDSIDVLKDAAKLLAECLQELRRLREVQNLATDILKGLEDHDIEVGLHPVLNALADALGLLPSEPSS